MFDQSFIERASALIAKCRARAVMLATAESCTGGLLAGLLTEIAGSSAVLDRGFVTYSNAAKREMLGVSEATLAEHGAVSSQTALAMAAGALARSGATIAIAITGIAGPGGETPGKPVGLVHFGLAVRDGSVHDLERRFGDIGRHGVRSGAIEQAMMLLDAAVTLDPPTR